MTADGRISKQGPLAGVKVLDFTRVIAGPYCTMMLADMSADVVKVEEPHHGDEMRNIVYEGRSPGDQDYFYSVNRSKRSVVLDLKKQDDRELSKLLAAKADIVVENYAPGVADRLGIGWNDLHGVNEQLVYCSISGFGQTGPYRSRPALDPVIQALSGVMSVTGYEGQEALTVGAPIADVVAGMFAAFAIVCAWSARSQRPNGQYIDVSMQDAMLAMLSPRMAEALQANRSPRRYGNGNPMRVPTNTYATKDDRSVMICVLNDRQWPPFCRALDRLDWLQKAEYATMKGRRTNRSDLDRAIQEQLRTRSAEEWRGRLEEHGVPYGLVNDYVQAIEDPQIKHREVIQKLLHPISGAIRAIGPPWRFDGFRPEMSSPPLLGEHKSEVVASWLASDASV